MFTSTMDTSLWHFNWLRFWMRPFIIDATQQYHSYMMPMASLGTPSIAAATQTPAHSKNPIIHAGQSDASNTHDAHFDWSQTALATPSSVILSTAQQYATSPSTSNNSKQIATNETMWVIAAHVT